MHTVLRPSFYWTAMRRVPWLVISPILITFGLLVAFGWWQYQLSAQYQQEVVALQQNQLMSDEEASSLLTSHLAAQEYQQQLEDALREATASDKTKASTALEKIYDSVANVLEKADRNEELKVKSINRDSSLAKWGKLLLEKRLDDLTKDLVQTSDSLDESYAEYQKSLVQAPPASPSTSTPPSGNSTSVEGYSNTQVSTSRGTFATKVLKLPLNEIKVRTVSASDGSCTEVACNAKSLAQYVTESGGIAGMNGTYFCPPDYAHCAGKAYSYNFAVYNTPTGNWVNQNALGWDNLIGLAVFNGSNASFYQYPNQWGRGPVTAGITNSPGLLVHNGTVTMTDAKLDSYQKSKGVRGALGVGGGYLYLAIVNSASITDAAYVMKAIGASNALNLDGGGSTALYANGQYLAGPGRLLPNAIVITR